MSDIHLIEDEATLYVLGRMTEIERREFETRLAESAELRALVRELGEGAVAVAMASPQRRVPSRVWEGIEKAIAEETRPRVMKTSFWIGFLRSGWAATAACLVGWLLYAFLMNRDVAPSLVVNVRRDESLANSAQTKSATSQSQNFVRTDWQPLQTNLKALTQENGTLRFQNAELARQVTHLSQVLTQQQVRLSESSRLKFSQLRPTSFGDADATNAIPSPELQRALFLAMARELGWLQSPGGEQSDSTFTNQTGVDFVDLHPITNQPKTSFDLQTEIAQEPDGLAGSASPSNLPDNGIPVLFFDDQTILAFEPSNEGTTTGSELGFWTGNSVEGFQHFGSAVMGTNIMVVGFPATSASPNGTQLTVTAATPSGSFNVIGQVPLPVTTPPQQNQP